MIYTFYSYKGGVGRSMALVNVAELMYRTGRKVIIVDWDLEAPGLERYYPERADEILGRLGVIDLLINYKERASRYRPEQDKPILSQEELKDYLIDLYPDSSSPSQLQLLSAGRRADKQFIDYATRVKSFDWQDFYQNWEGEVYFEWLRTQLNNLADVVFIDARTGVTEMGGVCTYQMADMIVMLCAANQQNMDGTQQMLESFSSPQLPPLRHDRELKVLVVPARIERVAEIQTLNRFRQEFAKRFLPYMNQISNQSDILVKLEIPYVPLYAFEEIIAVRQTNDEQRSVEMETAYNQLAQLITQSGVTKSQRKGVSLHYLDFTIEVANSGNGDYMISAYCPIGEARQIMLFPFTDTALETRLLKLENAILRSTGRRRMIRTPEEAEIQDFGRQLFTFLFSDDVLSLYRKCLLDANNQGKGLRIKLNVKAPELVELPWEFLYDPARRDYLCLDPNTPLVRFSELQSTVPPLSITPPLRILGLCIDTTDQPHLNVAEEKARMERAVQALQAYGLVELTWLDGQTAADLQRIMRRGPWHVLHFIGHGGFDAQRDEGVVFLADEQGHAKPLYATQLARLLALQRHSLRLVLLNTCDGARGGGRDLFSSTAATLVSSGIPAVLAMQYEITDEAAVDFARSFYEALADNLPIDSAVADARNALNLHNSYSLEWGTPVLYMRTSDGALFDIAGSINTTTPSLSTLAPTSAPSRSLDELRTTLAALYPDPSSISRLISDVGMDSSRISFANSAINSWHTILAEANKANQIDALLDAISREYNANETFRTTAAIYRKEQERRRKE